MSVEAHSCGRSVFKHNNENRWLPYLMFKHTNLEEKMPVKVLEQYSLPINNNLYGKPPLIYKEADTLLIPFMSDPKVISELVPEPMEYVAEGLVSAQFNKYNTIGAGRSIEIFLNIPVTFQGEVGTYIASAFLNNDRPMAAGREIWGFEKKMAQCEFEEKNDGIIYSSAERGGSIVQKGSVERKEIGNWEEVAGSLVYFCVKLIPSVEKDAPPAVAQLTRTELTGYKVLSIEKGPASLEFPMSPASFLHTVPILDVLGGYYTQWGCTLGYGTVVHDYLKPKKSARAKKS